jgi:hypothetical protein
MNFASCPRSFESLDFSVPEELRTTRRSADTGRSAFGDDLPEADAGKVKPGSFRRHFERPV